MPVLQDRVQETTTTGGTGTLTLAGAVTGYRSFNAAFTLGDITYYTIDNGSGEWEIGVGTVGSGTLSRNSVLESSNANALVNFSAGTKRVFCSAPTKVLLPDQTSNSGKVLTTNGTDPSWTTTLNGITLGNITPGSGAFTTLSASSTVSGSGFSTYLASPPAIGGTAPAAGNFTTLGATGNVTLGDGAGDTVTINGGTANGVAYLNGSKVLTTGSALTFDGTNLGVGGAASQKLHVQNAGAVIGLVQNTASTADARYRIQNTGGSSDWGVDGTGTYFQDNNSRPFLWFTAGSEQMRLTSNGLEVKQSQLIGYTSYAGLGSNGLAVAGNVGIGTSSPEASLHNNGVNGRLVLSAGNAPSSGATTNKWRFSLREAAEGDFNIQHYNGSSYDTPINITPSGNLGLGVTPSAWTSYKAIQLSGIVGIYGYGNDEYASVQNAYYNSGWKYGASSIASSWFQQYRGAFSWFTAAPGAAGATILFNQAMTLTAAGDLLVGKTSTGVANNGAVIFSAGTFQSTMAGTGTNYHAIFANNAGTTVGSITSSGSATVYNTLSDYRLKTNVAPAGSAVESILNFPVDQFDWIASGEHQYFGAVAQKAIHFIPEMVHAPADEDEMWGIDWSKAVPRLIKTVQELHAEIESLKAKVN